MWLGPRPKYDLVPDPDAIRSRYQMWFSPGRKCKSFPYPNLILDPNTIQYWTDIHPVLDPNAIWVLKRTVFGSNTKLYFGLGPNRTNNDSSQLQGTDTRLTKLWLSQIVCGKRYVVNKVLSCQIWTINESLNILRRNFRSAWHKTQWSGNSGPTNLQKRALPKKPSSAHEIEMRKRHRKMQKSSGFWFCSCVS